MRAFNKLKESGEGAIQRS